VKVVSRGGSLLLNVAPGPDGQLDSTAYVRLKEVGEWLKVNGEAVYIKDADTWSVSNGALSFPEGGRIIADTEVEAVDTRRRDDQYNYIFVDSASVGELDLGCRSDKLIGRPVILGNSKAPKTTTKDCRVVIRLTNEDFAGGEIKVIRVHRRMDRIV